MTSFVRAAGLIVAASYLMSCAGVTGDAQAASVVAKAGDAAVAASASASDPAALAPPVYTAAQAERGHEAYVANCLVCHGDALDNGQFAAPLKGPAFKAHFGGQGLDQPFKIMVEQMPPTAPGSLSPQVYADIMAYMLGQNGMPAGDKELPDDADALAHLAAPK